MHIYHLGTCRTAGDLPSWIKKMHINHFKLEHRIGSYPEDPSRSRPPLPPSLSLRLSLSLSCPPSPAAAYPEYPSRRRFHPEVDFERLRICSSSIDGDLEKNKKRKSEKTEIGNENSKTENENSENRKSEKKSEK